jgi:hypothetical protein
VVKRYALLALAGVLALAVSFAAGRYSRPAEVRTQVEFVDRFQSVHTHSVSRVTDIKWKKVTEAKPDGSSTTTETADTHIDERDSSKTETAKTTNSSNSTTTKNDVPQWTILAAGGVKWNPGSQASAAVAPVFGLILERRLFGPVKIAGFGFTSGTFGVAAGWEF